MARTSEPKPPAFHAILLSRMINSVINDPSIDSDSKMVITESLNAAKARFERLAIAKQQ